MSVLSQEDLKTIHSQQEEVFRVLASLHTLPVKECGVDPADGTASIWFKRLPEKKPYPNAEGPESIIEAIDVYRPFIEDPSLLSEEEAEKAGILRTFCYMAVPSDPRPGIVCVHGGGGHAYARTAWEAMTMGFASIATDTEGCRNVTGGEVPYGESEKDLPKDPLGHKGKDGFSTEREPIENQWIYQVLLDQAAASEVLRSQIAVKKVGITGLSWGGLVTTTVSVFDNAFAFAVPVYIGFHMEHSAGCGLDLPTHPYAAMLWQDPQLLKNAVVPTMMLAGDRDPFGTLDICQETADDMPTGVLNIKPNFCHCHNSGAAPAEIYRYGQMILGLGQGFITANEPIPEGKRRYTLTLSVPDDLKTVSVTLGYLTGPIMPYTGDKLPAWQFRALSYDAVTQKVTVEVPDDAYLYYLSFAGHSENVARMKKEATYGEWDAYDNGILYDTNGRILSSSRVYPVHPGDPIRG